MATRLYVLYVRDSGNWRELCRIEAPDHSAAFHQAILALHPDHYDKPIRFEQVVHNPPLKL